MYNYKEIEDYLRDNNASIRFTNDKRVEVKYDYGEKGKFDSYQNLDELFSDIPYQKYKESLDLYVEISGRQTGKTTRLIEAMYEHLKHGGTCCLFTHSQEWGKLICKQLNEKYQVWINNNVFINPKPQDFAFMEVNKISRLRYFYDEFEFCENIRYQPYGYYCTTLNKLRDYGEYLKYRRNTTGIYTTDSFENIEPVFNLMIKSHNNVVTHRSNNKNLSKVEQGYIFE
jgi:hypothetical protein